MRRIYQPDYLGDGTISLFANQDLLLWSNNNIDKLAKRNKFDELLEFK